MNELSRIELKSRSRMSRRKFSIVAGSCVSMFGLADFAFGSDGAPEDEITHACETIHQTVTFKANRKRVYEVLTSEKEFDKVVKLSAAMQSGEMAALGNKPTQIARDVGGTFTLFGGHIVGRHLELMPGERIVQAWRVVPWEVGVFSVVRFQLLDEGAETKLVFDHTGFPNGQGDHLAKGWKGNYWEPMAKVLA